MGYRHTHEEVLQGAIDVAVEQGLSRLSFGRVATRLGVSDRVVVYYFPNKPTLIGAVLGALGSNLQAGLDRVVPDTPFETAPELVTALWPKLANPAADPTFALFFEAAGLASSGLEPYCELVPALFDEWIEWATQFFVGDRRNQRRQAAAAVATIDGLLLMRQLSGPRAANDACTAITATTES